MAREANYSGERYWFAPVYNGGERDDPNTEGSFRVFMRTLTGTEISKIRAKEIGKVTGRDVNWIARAETSEEATLAAAVERVEGYGATVRGKRYQPTNARGLIEAVKAVGGNEVEILNDILKAAVDESYLRGDLPNGSSSPSASG